MSYSALRKHSKKYTFKHHFVPHAYHKTRAHLISSKALLAYIFLFVLGFWSIRFTEKYSPGTLGYASDINVSDLLRYTNETRSNFGKSQLTLNSTLNVAAQKKAEDMFRDNYWAHIAPDGREPWDFILEANYDYLYAGENLAKNFNTSRAVVDAWYDSPTHRDNLLNGDYQDIGFAVVNGVLEGYETTLVVQMFGTPRLRQASVVTGVPAEQNQVAAVPTPIPAPTSQVAQAQDSVIEETTPAPIETDLQPEPTLQPIYIPPQAQPQVLPAFNVAIAYKTISIGFVIFLCVLLILDVWYSKKKGIPKITGNTVAHLIFLIITILGVLLVFAPGKIL